ncbi:MAG: sigma-70 family RNA polymerase sigma factor [Dehalococcoidia bacterium]|nr:MAG: sigma-70 family RNA polymerase sigma factor [Dehalococcoidia bacterium]
MVYLRSLPELYWQPVTAVKEPRLQKDEIIARQIRKRDPEAWARIYEEFFPRIYRFIALKVRNRTEAEDLTEQVFLKALEASPSFKWRGAPISSWLFRIAHNQVIDYYRTDKSRRLLPLDESLASDGIDPEKAAETNWEVRQAIIAVSELTQAQRNVIELRFAGGLSTAEVAKVLGKRQGAVKALQHSAIAALRKKLSRCNDYDRTI